MKRQDRRLFLKTIAATTTVGIAGCSDSDGGGGAGEVDGATATSEDGAGGDDTDGNDDSDDETMEAGRESWPQVAYDACNSRYAPGITFPNTGSLEMKWEYSLGGEERWAATGDVIVGEGLVVKSWVGPSAGQRNRVVALNEATGEKVWEYEGEEEMTLSVIYDGVVYTASRAPGGGRLVAIDANTGNKLWSEPGVLSPDIWLREGTIYTLSSESRGPKMFDLDDGSKTNLTNIGLVVRVVGDHIYTTDATSSDYSIISAHDRESMGKLWEVNWDETEVRLERGPICQAGTVILGDSSGELHALEGDTGEVRWSTQVVDPATDPGGAFYASPTVTDETVYVGGDGSLYALSVRDGSEKWSREFGGPDFEGFQTAANDESVIFWTLPAIYALDPEDGSTQWEFPLDNLLRMGAAVANGAFYGIHSGDLVRKYAPV